MKREQNLVPLSWNHHTGLSIAKRIQEQAAAGISPSKLRDYVRCHWDADLWAHFQKEEERLAMWLQDDGRGRALWQATAHQRVHTS
ncbi:MAG: hypothetical protein ACLFTT_15205 [Candidatus Hydrogenedentota bacterium]